MGEGYHLFVGRLDGRAYDALTADTEMATSAVVDGHVLAAWLEDSEYVIALFDTATGDSSELARVEDDVKAVAFGPGESFYFVTRSGAAHDNNLWRADAGDEPAMIGESWQSPSSHLTRSADGQLLAIWSYVADGEYSYQLLDTATDELGQIPSEGHGEVVGILGGDLIVWTNPFTDSLDLPRSLTRIAPEGDAQLLVETVGIWAAAFPDTNSDAVLAFDSEGEGEVNAISTITAGGTPHMIFTGTDSWEDPDAPGFPHDGGIESPGWIPVFPGRQTYQWPHSGDAHRLLVPIGGGSAVDIGPQPPIDGAP